MSVKQFYKSFTTAEAITANSFVVENGAGAIIMADAVTEVVLGVCHDDVASGAVAKVQLFGVAKVRTSEAIAVNEYVGPSTTDGQAKDADTTGDTIAGIALTATEAGPNEMVEILLFADKANAVP